MATGFGGSSSKEISDSELRRRLLRLNQTVGPITSTTRSVYLRKLSAAAAAATGRTTDRSAPMARSSTDGGRGGHRFSSDESDDEDDLRSSSSSCFSRPSAATTIRRPFPRRTEAQASSPPRVYGSDWYDREPPNRSYSATFNAPAAKICTQFEKEKEEEEEESTGTWGTSASLCRPSINGAGLFKYSSQPNSTSSFGLKRNDDGLNYSSTMNSYRNDSRSPTSEQNARFRGLFGNDFKPSSSTGTVQRKHDWNSFSTTRDQQLPTRPVFDQAADSSLNEISSTRLGRSTAGKWQLVSMLLVAVVAVFFILVGYVYWYMTSSRVDPRNDYLLCADDDRDVYVECIPRQSLPWILELTKNSVNFISTRAGDFDCGYEDTRNITLQEFSFLIERHMGEYFHNRLQVKTLILKLFVANPHWTIRLYSSENLVTSDVSEVKYLMSDKSQMSFWCRFRLSALRVLSVLLSVIFAFVILLLGFGSFKMWKKWKEEETKEVLKLVEGIIDKVKQQADLYHLHSEVLPYVAIAHVRDSLIPLMERQKKQRVWDKAVEFISTHESRIRTEDQKIESEDFTVWRWVSPPTDVTKVWQGQAFGEHGDRVHLPTLTTCLKIRNMFDADTEYGADWHVSVEDAIIEKCGLNHGILHIAVDRASKDGCVYVRCRDLSSAGRAFKALHGWWFDGKLVTVKYLREQRYYERFPEAAYVSEPVKPSNANQTSLSQPFHSSIIESS